MGGKNGTLPGCKIFYISVQSSSFIDILEVQCSELTSSSINLQIFCIKQFFFFILSPVETMVLLVAGIYAKNK